LRARLNEAKARCGALSASKAFVQSDLHIVEDKQKTAKESQRVLTKKLEKAESRGRRLKKKCKHYKSKAAWFLKQLSFLPWLRDQSWVRGFH
jgi:chromosome segregation ATPase